MVQNPLNLPWPTESAHMKAAGFAWSHSGSNICLDFHGDPCRAGLVVFSDGNHHMALEECLQAFVAMHPELEDIFYATTPPGVLVSLLKRGHVQLGNLRLSRLPDVFIGPREVLAQLAAEGLVQTPRLFMQSRCNVLLIHADNPHNIRGIADLLNEEVRLFISNPVTEQASYQVYSDTLLALAREQGLAIAPFEELLSGQIDRLVCGECIHHRELPQAIADGLADAAIVYYHLALRYTRIFPGRFRLLPLAGSETYPLASPAHQLTDYYVASLTSNNPFLQPLMSHLFSQHTTDIYAHHGLVRPDNVLPYTTSTPQLDTTRS